MEGYQTKAKPHGKDGMKVPSKKQSNHPPRELTTEENIEYKVTFDFFDKAHTGLVPIKDLAVMVRAAGKNPTEEQIEDLKKEAKKTDDDVMNIEGFCNFMLRILESRTPEEELMDAFRTFDANDSGYILVEELRHVMLNLGDKLSQEEVDCMISQGDPENTGKINYAEFTALLLSDADD